MKRTFSLLSLTACALLFMFSSCKKGYEVIHNPNQSHTPCQISKIVFTSLAYQPDDYDIFYNAHGTPDSMIDNHPAGNYGNPRYFFRYDSLGRLSDWMLCNQPFSSYGGYFAFAWHKYEWTSANYVIDTLITYAGDVHGPRPIASQINTSNTIWAYTLDSHGRISKDWTIKGYNESTHAPVLGATYVYDSTGNLPLTDTTLTYDNKINLYRTNWVWEFIFHDFNRNNTIKKTPFFGGYAYNTYGLPTDMEPNYLGFAGQFNIINNGPNTQFSYACSMDQGPVDY